LVKIGNLGFQNKLNDLAFRCPAMLRNVVRLLVTEVLEGPIGPIFKGLQDGTNRAPVLKCQQLTTEQSCLTSQKNEDVNYTLAETRNLANSMCILFLNIS
jgi:hypothetical protein